MKQLFSIFLLAIQSEEIKNGNLYLFQFVSFLNALNTTSNNYHCNTYVNTHI